MGKNIEVGDRVRVSGSYINKPDLVGKEGNVIIVDDGSIAVEFDEKFYGGHSAGGHGQYGHCYWVLKYDLEIIMQPGDRARVEDLFN